jgi:hypothetical protein
MITIIDKNTRMSLFLTSCMSGSNGNVANVGQQRQHDALNCRQGLDFESVVISATAKLFISNDRPSGQTISAWV